MTGRTNCYEQKTKLTMLNYNNGYLHNSSLFISFIAFLFIVFTMSNIDNDINSVVTKLDCDLELSPNKQQC